MGRAETPSPPSESSDPSDSGKQPPEIAIEPFVPRSPAFFEAVRTYHDAWRDIDDGEYVDAIAMISRHSGYPGFLGLLARDTVSGQPVGMGYGHADRPGQWWHERVAPYLPPERAGWLENCFVVVELAVRAEHRRRGIGRALLERLTESRPEARAALSTQQDNLPARSLYSSLGWRILIEPMHFTASSPPYVVLGRELHPVAGAMS